MFRNGKKLLGSESLSGVSAAIRAGACAVVSSGVNRREEPKKRGNENELIRKHTAKYSARFGALAWSRAAWTARRKPARVEGGPLVCAVGTAVPDASRGCQ